MKLVVYVDGARERVHIQRLHWEVDLGCGIVEAVKVESSGRGYWRKTQI